MGVFVGVAVGLEVNVGLGVNVRVAVCDGVTVALGVGEGVRLSVGLTRGVGDGSDVSVACAAAGVVGVVGVEVGAWAIVEAAARSRRPVAVTPSRSDSNSAP